METELQGREGVAIEISNPEVLERGAFVQAADMTRSDEGAIENLHMSLPKRSSDSAKRFGRAEVPGFSG
jgi:hypothetical protein